MLSEEDYNILRLFRSENVGPFTFFKLLNFFSSCQNAIDNIQEFNKKSRQKNPIVLATKEKIDKEIVGCSTMGAKIITYRNKDYPKLLSTIDNFPPLLTMIGNYNLLTKRSVSIVGSRNASSNGCNFARKLARELGEAGYIITTGLASGIDTSAHKGSINTGTIAVLGGGVDDIYPKGNEELYYEIKNKGLIISEVPLNSVPRAENFPARNRIISGLSDATVIIEAGARSGTLHTARQTIEQGRELLVVPGNPYDYRSEGSNKLLKDGATVITNTEDVLYILNDLNTNKTNENSFILKDNQNNNFNEIKKEEALEYNYLIDENELVDSRLTNINEIILSKLNSTPISTDSLCNDLDYSAQLINPKLIELELEGKITIEYGMIKIKD